MQDRYAGDIGDYGKFGMLRALASEGLSVGVNWYLVETSQQEASVNDGQKLIPERLTSCDPALAVDPPGTLVRSRRLPVPMSSSLTQTTACL